MPGLTVIHVPKGHAIVTMDFTRNDHNTLIDTINPKYSTAREALSGEDGDKLILFIRALSDALMLVERNHRVCDPVPMVHCVFGDMVRLSTGHDKIEVRLDEKMTVPVIDFLEDFATDWKRF